jgi:hypothetical protein
VAKAAKASINIRIVAAEAAKRISAKGYGGGACRQSS